MKCYNVIHRWKTVDITFLMLFLKKKSFLILQSIRFRVSVVFTLRSLPIYIYHGISSFFFSVQRFRVSTWRCLWVLGVNFLWKWNCVAAFLCNSVCRHYQAKCSGCSGPLLVGQEKKTPALNENYFKNLQQKKAKSSGRQDSISGWVFSGEVPDILGRAIGWKSAQQASCVAVFAFAKEGK